jgi:Lon protease-like protein
MTTLPMFPLGSVLFPHMPLQLRVFEERYVVMLSRILQAEPAEFGVVLIERGQEVGGGDERFGLGTVARIGQLEAVEGFIAVIARGDRRIEVIEWDDAEPYPQAAVRVLDDLVWDEGLQPLRDRAEQEVRRALALASEFVDQQWSATVEISDDPVEGAWQLAGIAPLGSLDQIALLRSTSMAQLLGSLIEFAIVAGETIGELWPGELQGENPDDESPDDMPDDDIPDADR